MLPGDVPNVVGQDGPSQGSEKGMNREDRDEDKRAD
jgi:hypothetical protein